VKTGDSKYICESIRDGQPTRDGHHRPQS